MTYTIMQGDNKDTLKTLEDNSIDAIITDPPYGIDFLGKAWDANTGALETYQECLRVLKPGGYILAFSAARTYHHLAITLEQAGFEIRDQLMWLYASGFPKAQDIGKAIQKRQGVEEYEEIIQPKNEGMGTAYNDKAYRYNEDNSNETVVRQRAICTSPLAQQWSGWKTALKPAHEPICMARKPFKGSTIDNVLTHGVGALNIDATRIETQDKIAEPKRGGAVFKQSPKPTGWNLNPEDYNSDYKSNEAGRFPSNVLGEIEGYQKFFYCPKVSRKERHIGFDLSTTDSVSSMLEHMNGYYIDNLGNPVDYKDRNDCSQVFLPHLGPIYIHGLKHEYEKWIKTNNLESTCGNNHPTVKPVALMRYLIQLVTPPNSIVLDPFNGSGSTGMAAVELGHTYIGCELDPAYVEIAKRRIEAWNAPEHTGTTYNELFE